MIGRVEAIWYLDITKFNLNFHAQTKRLTLLPLVDGGPEIWGQYFLADKKNFSSLHKFFF
jgi:hypothetical protein